MTPRPDVVRLLDPGVELGRGELPRYISLASLARRLDVSRSWIAQWHHDGILRGQLLQGRPGTRGVIIFRLDDVLAFLRSRGFSTDGSDE